MKLANAERGEANALLLSVITLTVLFLAAASFAVWAYLGRQDYKNNSDAKAAAAVAANKTVVQAQDAAQYAEASKSPIKTYIGPDAYGSVHVSYPKTWSAYIDTASDSSLPLNAYFHSDFVPSVQSKQTYDLRVQVVARAYSSEVTRYASYVTRGTVKASAYSFPKVPSVVGTRLDGQIQPSYPDISGSLVLMPLRDKTLEVWTESNASLSDFNTYVLPNLTFSP